VLVSALRGYDSETVYAEVHHVHSARPVQPDGSCSPGWSAFKSSELAFGVFQGVERSKLTTGSLWPTSDKIWWLTMSGVTEIGKKTQGKTGDSIG